MKRVSPSPARSAASRPGSCRRTRACISRKPRPGSVPSSSASRRRVASNAASASAWRPERVSVHISSSVRRSRQGNSTWAVISGSRTRLASGWLRSAAVAQSSRTARRCSVSTSVASTVPRLAGQVRERRPAPHLQGSSQHRHRVVVPSSACVGPAARRERREPQACRTPDPPGSAGSRRRRGPGESWACVAVALVPVPVARWRRTSGERWPLSPAALPPRAGRSASGRRPRGWPRARAAPTRFGA